jgi:hypothetical protein
MLAPDVVSVTPGSPQRADAPLLVNTPAKVTNDVRQQVDLVLSMLLYCGSLFLFLLPVQMFGILVIKASATDKQAFAAMVQKLTVVTIVLAFLFPLMVRFLRKPDFIWGVQRKHKPVSLFLLTLLTTFVVIVCLSSITKQAHEAFDIAKLTAENTRLQKNIAKAAKLAEEREAGILRATQAHESIKVNLDDQIASLKAQMA